MVSLIRRHTGLIIGTLALGVSVPLIMSAERLGWIDPERLDQSVWVLQAMRVVLVLLVLGPGMRYVAILCERRTGDSWQWLIIKRARLVFWYLAIELLLFWGTL